MKNSKKTLFDFWSELDSISFDKRKAQGLVKRANTAGFPIYYAYHEDGQDTWRSGWATSDYKENGSDELIFKATELIQKKKRSFGFNKAATYTAECAIFIFCPIQTLMADSELSERKIRAVKAKAANSAMADFEEANIRLEKKKETETKVTEWENFPNDVKEKIEALTEDYNKAINYTGAKFDRERINKEISDLGGRKPIVDELHNWVKEALAFDNIESYIEFREKKAVDFFLKSIQDSEEE